MPGTSGGWRDWRRRLNFNVVLALACMAFGLLLFVLIPHQVERPPRLFGMADEGLDPAFFPNLVAAGFLIVGALYLASSVNLVERNGFDELGASNYVNIGVTVLVFVAYAALLRPLGFLLSSGLVVATLSVFYGARHIPSILLVSIGVPFGVYLIFRRALSVALPEFPDF